jgi:hypothetical protein
MGQKFLKLLQQDSDAVEVALFKNWLDLENTTMFGGPDRRALPRGPTDPTA